MLSSLVFVAQASPTRAAAAVVSTSARAQTRSARVSVRDENVAALARLLYESSFEDTGDALLVALDAEQDLVALSIADCEAILRVLDDPPIGLAELRGVLLAEHRSRARDGLV